MALAVAILGNGSVSLGTPASETLSRCAVCVQANSTDGAASAFTGRSNVIIMGLVNVLKPHLVGANPVRQITQPQEVMLERRFRRQRLDTVSKCLRKPTMCQLPDA